MASTIQITNDDGLTFTVRRVEFSDSYGRKFVLRHMKHDPLIEFYDTRHAFDLDEQGRVLGQFVSRYYASTLLAGRKTGLNLDGRVAAWSVDKAAMDIVREFAS